MGDIKNRNQSGEKPPAPLLEFQAIEVGVAVLRDARERSHELVVGIETDHPSRRTFHFRMTPEQVQKLPLRREPEP